MNSDSGIEWRFIIVEDNEDLPREIIEECPRFVEPSNTAVGKVFNDFDEAARALPTLRYDFLIID